jgi:MoxR-like ATPase
VGRPPSSAGAAWLYHELARLSEETRARLRDGDDDFLEAALERRDALLAAIAETPVRPGEAPEVSAAIRQALALDRELLALLESRREEVRRDIARITEGRAALQSYRGAAPSGAIYIERLS